jgi:hypothetical protein
MNFKRNFIQAGLKRLFERPSVPNPDLARGKRQNHKRPNDPSWDGCERPK